MRTKFWMAAGIMCLIARLALASQSTITESEGAACMGDDKSRKQTEQAAVEDAKRKAVEFASTYMKSQTDVKNFVLENDLVSAYARATIKIIQELEKSWYKDPSRGECYKIVIKAEVIPDEKSMEALSRNAAAGDDPSAPLNIRVWTDKKAYKTGEKVKVFIKGNKPFYARVMYKDAAGSLVQLLPNPFRSGNYFNGGTIYEIPSGDDRFELEVNPPFGNENIIVYASTSALGDISLKAEGGVYQVDTKTSDVEVKTRGVKLTQKAERSASSPDASEFYENNVVVTTGK
jgi:Domain of unknown function (DUF4384)